MRSPRSLLTVFGLMIFTSLSFAVVLTFFLGDWGFIWALVLAGLVSPKLSLGSEARDAVVAGISAGLCFTALFGTAISCGFYWKTFPAVLGVIVEPYSALLVIGTTLLSIFGGLGALVWRKKEIAPVNLPTSEIRFYCPICGKILKPGDVYCSNCGVRIDELDDAESETSC